MAMLANLFSFAKYGRFRKGSSDFPSQDNIPLSQLGSTLQDQAIQDIGNRRARNYWHLLCYLLHAFLIALHLTLLVLAVSHHPEHQVVISYDTAESFISGLTAGLQAFYTLYTALLVFVTQKLMLSAIFATPKKLTQIHDMCGAWAGFGSALNALWQQTRVTSSVLSIVLVTMYFTCILVLHITSSTLMQFQIFQPIIGVSPVVGNWPTGTTSIDLASLDWMATAPLVPFLQLVDENQTLGLVNSTLFEFPAMGTAFTILVNASTLDANCGLLANLSVDSLENNEWNVKASILGLGPINITVSYSPLLNEILSPPSIQCSEPMCSTFMIFLVSAEMEVDDSVDDVNHFYANGTYYSPDGTTQNFSTPIYFVACSLNATNHFIAIDSGWTPLDSKNQTTDPNHLTWSTFSATGSNLNLTSAISHAMQLANSLPSSSYCQPIILDAALQWANITAFDVYMRMALGMDISPCFDSFEVPLGQYTSNQAFSLNRSQFESTVSQIAAKFIWLAGQVGKAGGGFDLSLLESSIPMIGTSYQLNINLLPVIFALCASLILLLVLFILWKPCQGTVSSAGVLEIMWFGSHSQMLRDHLSNMQSPSLDSLRASAMFKTIFWTHIPYREEENNTLYNSVHMVAPFCNQGTPSRDSRSLQLFGSESGNHYTSGFTGVSQSRPLWHASNSSWCYALHIVLVGWHITLLAFLAHHPEESIVIANKSAVATLGLSTLLQATYTLYTSVLVFLMQRLALLKIISERQNLTTIHDVSGSWSGIGGAIHILWKQRRRSSSFWKTITVVAYLTAMLVLHIASSSVMGWQLAYTPSVTVQMDLAMPSATVNLSQLGWSDIFPIARAIAQNIDRFSTLGLQNTTIYDGVSQTQDDLSTLLVTGPINATTLTARCGLVPNLTLSYQSSEGQYQINFWNGVDNGAFLERPIWKDVVHAIVPTFECIACPQTLFYLITTGIQVNESVHDPVVIELNWTYTPSEGENAQTSTVLTYVAACSLNSQTFLTPLNQTIELEAPSPASTSWSVWLPENATNFNFGMATALSKDVTGSFPMFFQGNYSVNFTDIDGYIMSSLGLNLTNANMTAASESGANPSTILSPWQLENVIVQAAATMLWTAGQLGENWGGFEPSLGETQGINLTILWCLHLNTIPVVFASIASFASLILAIVIIGKGPPRGHPTSISGTSVLECLWLEAHSELLHSRLQTIEEPRLDALRAAGMFDICLGDIGRSSYAEAEQPILEVADE